MKSVLITGGAGFIGSHLAEHYARLGSQVYLLDDLSTGNIRNVSAIRELPNVHVTIEDVRNRQVLAELVDQADVIFHMAAAVGVRLVVESPVYTIENNLHGTEAVLSAANKKKKKVLIASTSEVYGCSDKIPFREDDFLVLGGPTKGRWSYACSKALDEFLALAYFKEKRLPVVVARLFNTVGPRQTGRYGMVLPNFVRQALSHHDITVFGDGSQTRSFTHVTDAVRALTTLVETDIAMGDVFNVGGQEEISILALAERVVALTHSRSSIVTIPYDRAYEAGFEDMPRRLPSLEKINAMIGYAPSFSLDEIILSVAEYQRTSELAQ
jgi:UDP-glucose 4-epimerase